MVAAAERLELYIAMLPTWGGFVTDVKTPQNVVFNMSNAREYGRFLGQRYRHNTTTGAQRRPDPAESHEPF